MIFWRRCVWRADDALQLLLAKRVHGWQSPATDIAEDFKQGAMSRNIRLASSLWGGTYTITDALGNITKWQYDSVGNVTQLTDANTDATKFSYDAVYRPLCETFADR